MAGSSNSTGPSTGPVSTPNPLTGFTLKEVTPLGPHMLALGEEVHNVAFHMTLLSFHATHLSLSYPLAPTDMQSFVRECEKVAFAYSQAFLSSGLPAALPPIPALMPTSSSVSKLDFDALPEYLHLNHSVEFVPRDLRQTIKAQHYVPLNMLTFDALQHWHCNETVLSTETVRACLDDGSSSKVTIVSTSPFLAGEDDLDKIQWEEGVSNLVATIREELGGSFGDMFHVWFAIISSPHP
ncbi:hypothetical protein BS47DRAFT_1399523 [Hydnum rufescens UP504]|uniref:Uncharacterized protein n=1 Tax=Hydnum rufescens UP504 TaxID=1448309 RepID=A0A9P6DQ84_9AGAM|nr:hypothetical protein BS47DRAFT_1399523 [Hydnum rufescens UP504]